MQPPLDELGFDAGASCELITGGLINHTWCVRDQAGAPVGVAQKLHSVFGAEVNLDIDAVTRRLEAEGIETPRVLPAADGALWVEREGEVWRSLSYLPGVTVHRVTELAQAESAGALVGRVHRALADFEYDYRFTRAGVHDTAAHLAKLEALARAGVAVPAVRELAAEVLTCAQQLPGLPDLPRRHCHGDLKISNVLFADRQTWRARCLLDLDTVGLQTIAYELGDALRSWCNPAGEDVAEPMVELEIFEAALRGYAAGAPGLLSADEIGSIAPGLAIVSLELAARFAADAIEDRYFGWDPERFASRRDHNVLRARGQLALARSALAQLDHASAIAREALGQALSFARR